MADQGQQMFEGKPDQGEQRTMFSVGGRDYTADEAKKKIENADMFIDTLKGEKTDQASEIESLRTQVKTLTRQLDTSKKLEDFLESKQEPAKEPEPQQAQTTPAVDERTILDKLKAELAAESQQDVRASNMQKAITAASKIYGNEWQAQLLEKGSQLGMDKSSIQNMAETSPQAFAKLFGLESDGSATPAPQGSSSGDTPTQEQKPKSVMFGSTTKDLVEQWRYSGKRVGEELGFDYNSDIHKLPKQR